MLIYLSDQAYQYKNLPLPFLGDILGDIIAYIKGNYINYS